MGAGSMRCYYWLNIKIWRHINDKPMIDQSIALPPWKINDDSLPLRASANSAGCH
jgi:hypothetical protein